MTTEKILERLTKALECANDEQRTAAELMVRDGVKNADRLIAFEFNTGAIIQELIFAMQDDIKAKEMKSSGKTNVAKICNKLLKGVPDSRPMLKYAHVEGDYQLFCDNYRLICLGKENHVATDDVPQSMRDYPYPVTIAKAVPTGNGKPVELFDLASLKAWYKIQKAQHKGNKDQRTWKTIDFGAEYTVNIDADYLIDAMEICGKDCVCTVHSFGTYKFEGNGNICIVMGIRLDDGVERKRTEV